MPNCEPNVFKEKLNIGKNYEEYLEEERKRKLKLLKEGVKM